MKIKKCKCNTDYKFRIRATNIPIVQWAEVVDMLQTERKESLFSTKIPKVYKHIPIPFNCSDCPIEDGESSCCRSCPECDWDVIDRHVLKSLSTPNPQNPAENVILLSEGY